MTIKILGVASSMREGSYGTRALKRDFDTIGTEIKNIVEIVTRSSK